MSQRLEEIVRSLYIGVIILELPHGCYELNPGPLQEQPVS